MRISDWSSDVCSSDLEDLARLLGARPERGVQAAVVVAQAQRRRIGLAAHQGGVLRRQRTRRQRDLHLLADQPLAARRVGHVAVVARTSVVEVKSVSVRVDRGGGRNNKKKYT